MVVGELSALHVSVRGGDLRQGTDQIRVATLGARLERDDLRRAQLATEEPLDHAGVVARLDIGVDG